MPHRRRRPLLLTTPVVLLAMAWLAWAAAARHRLAAARATLTAAGEPVDVTGLLGPPVPPDRNAADLYLPAARALVPNVYGPSSSNLLFPSVPPLFPPAWMAMAGPAAAANAPAFALVRQARARPDADWHVVPGKPLLQTLLPHLNDSRELANELADAALVSHLRGDDAEAVERVRDLLAMADAVDRSRVPTARRAPRVRRRAGFGTVPATGDRDRRPHRHRAGGHPPAGRRGPGAATGRRRPPPRAAPECRPRGVGHGRRHRPLVGQPVDGPADRWPTWSWPGR